MEILTVGSLFSGIGGIELGFKRAGFKTKWFIEREPYAQAVIKKHWPHAKIYDDITQVNFAKLPKVNILTGGFPCQDISNAGKRAGIKGSRSSLWKYYLTAIGTLRPRIALIENVSALLGRGLNTILCDLAKIGYDAEWHCISASSVGALHRRERIFILAYPNLCRYIHSEVKVKSTERREQTFSKFKPSCEDVANTNSERLKEQWKPKPTYKRKGGEKFKCRGQWTVEPLLGRVVDGVPRRVDRIKCLGNAVVPQVAQVFAEAIKEVEYID